MAKKVIIITGASSGFGADFARQCLHGFQFDEFWLVARRVDKMTELAKELNKPSQIIKADLTDRSDLDMLANRLKNEKPEIVLLINNAGYGRVEKFAQSDYSYTLGMIDLNVRALVELSYHALPLMDNNSGIINLASSAAFSPMPNFAVYAATKSFVLNFSYALREELIERRIKVLAVCPGPARTEFFSDNSKKMILGVPVAESSAVVKKALADYKKGRSVSVYGLPMQLSRFFSALMPRGIVAKIAGKLKI